MRWNRGKNVIKYLKTKSYNLQLSYDITEDHPQNEFNTIGGLILDQLTRMPNVGDTIQWHGYELEIIDMDGLRIDKVLIKELEPEEEEEEED